MFKGIRVENDCVIVKMANNDAAREMCGKLLGIILMETARIPATAQRTLTNPNSAGKPARATTQTREAKNNDNRTHNR